jgi:hypothetical protein
VGSQTVELRMHGAIVASLVINIDNVITSITVMLAGNIILHIVIPWISHYKQRRLQEIVTHDRNRQGAKETMSRKMHCKMLQTCLLQFLFRRRNCHLYALGGCTEV